VTVLFAEHPAQAVTASNVFAAKPFPAIRTASASKARVVPVPARVDAAGAHRLVEGGA
jgi:hypothetical protein